MRKEMGNSQTRGAIQKENKIVGAPGRLALCHYGHVAAAWRLHETGILFRTVWIGSSFFSGT